MYLTLVRTAAVTALTGLPTTGTRVSTIEAYPLQPSDLPALIVRTGATPEVHDLAQPPTLRVDTRITVDTLVRANAGAADLLDTIAAEVTGALCALTTIGGRQVTVAPAEVPEPEFSGELDQPVARRALVFVASPLFVSALAPGVLI